ncbi:conserved exported hypothetical protein [Cupriavidus necator]|uniref:MYND finger n=1 Tax=Cupriavidus necator TaxID=106590 RepID=A0A1K0IN83_CUPNE|nr:conserved exported hypothetical protein [Cupriavidus necator]
MVRILILLAVVLGVIWWLRTRAQARLAEHRARQAREASERTAAAGPADATAEPMVQCAQCGVHLPQGEAIAWRGLHYCRRSHLPDESRAEGSDGSSGGPRP